MPPPPQGEAGRGLLIMKQTLQHLFNHKTLSRKEAKQVLTDIAAGKFNHSQIASFLTVFRMRTITVEELSGFREALLELCLPVDLSDFNTIDMCGTGGDGKDTFNISTLASFIVAGAGEKVAKHGNYGVSSSCGSSNVMEYLGYRFTNNTDTLRKQLDKAGICVLHAPLFHPAMKSVAPVRKDMSIKTFFNMLGPLVNPSFPQNQLVGVYDLELARLYNYMLQTSDKNYSIIHSLDGYDEVSLTGDFKVISNYGEMVISPEQMGMKTILPEEIFGGNSIPEAAKIFTDILDGKGTKAQQNVVIANAALGLQCIDHSKPLDEHIEKAKDSLHSGKAKKALKKLLEIK